jgi:hypothetical protein
LITSARYLAWFVALIGALMATVAGSYLLFGVPEFTVDGAPVESPAQASRALATAVGVLCVGVALATVLQTRPLNRLPAMLGFQLINPAAYLIPGFLTYAARFLHFFFLVGASLSIFFLPLLRSQQAELGMSIPFGAGAAAGASQFLRFWSSRQ